MKNKLLLSVVVLLSIIYCLGSFKKETSFFSNEVIIKNMNTNEVISLEMENYLVGVLAAEMPASFEYEALKAQAVASRTYAYYKVLSSTKEYDLTTDSTTQNYINEDQMKEKWLNDYELYIKKIKDAIKETKNEVLYYDNKVISAYYFAMSNGYTEDASLVFGETKDYLESVVSKEDTENRNYKQVQEFEINEFCTSLDISCSSIKITNTLRSASNRVNSITINDKSFKGTELRKLLKIRSTDFEIEISDKVYITTYGYGHGVGMSQYGANTMAKSGKNYKEILAHYYKNTTLDTIRV